MENHKRNENGYSLMELLVVVSIVITVAALAIPNFLHARVTSNGASAVSSLRAINTAMVSYSQSYPTVGYAASLAALGGTDCSNPGSASACLIDSSLASGTKSNYTFTASSTGGSPHVQYFAQGVPIQQDGGRSYCATEDATIHYDPSGQTIADHDACVALAQIQ